MPVRQRNTDTRLGRVAAILRAWIRGRVKRRGGVGSWRGVQRFTASQAAVSKSDLRVLLFAEQRYHKLSIGLLCHAETKFFTTTAVCADPDYLSLQSFCVEGVVRFASSELERGGTGAAGGRRGASTRRKKRPMCVAKP